VIVGRWIIAPDDPRQHGVRTVGLAMSEPSATCRLMPTPVPSPAGARSYKPAGSEIAPHWVAMQYLGFVAWSFGLPHRFLRGASASCPGRHVTRWPGYQITPARLLPAPAAF